MKKSNPFVCIPMHSHALESEREDGKEREKWKKRHNSLSHA